MSEAKINILFKEFSSLNDKKRVESVYQLFEFYQKNEDLQESIMNRLVEGLVSGPRRGLTNAFHRILKSLDNKSLEEMIKKLTKHLFINDASNLTKSELNSMHLGSILAFDALVTSDIIKNIKKETLFDILKFVLEFVNDKYFGYISVNVLSNYFKSISKKDFEKVKTIIKKEVFNVNNFDNSPHIIILWLSFNPEQKKILNSVNKSIPSIQSSGIVSKLPNLLKNLKSNQMIFLLDTILSTQQLNTVVSSVIDISSKSSSDLKDKQLTLTIGFQILKPNKASLINKLSMERRKSLIDLVWGNEVFLDLLCKQLSSTEFELHETCVKFFTSFKNLDPFYDNSKSLFAYAFNVLLMNKNFINLEYKICQTKRISCNIIQHIDNSTNVNNYLILLKELFDKSNKNDFKIYILEQFSSLFIKLPEIIIDILLTINIKYNHSNDTNDSRVLDSAKSSYLRCLETVQLTELEKLKSLLQKSEEVCKSDLQMQNVIKSVLQNWEISPPKSKKRNATDLVKLNIDFTNKLDSMFVALQSQICLYMLSQSFDEETKDILEDVKSSFREFKNNVNDIEVSKKRVKSNDTLLSTERTWKLVLTDILTLFMEQNCHYLRSLSVKVFKIFVTEGYCDESVIALIRSTIVDIDIEINGVDKKKKNKELNNENIGDENFCDLENEDRNDSDVENDEDDDSESGESNDEEGEDTEENQNEIKNRIFAALGAMNVDVDSDADDNCPDDDGTISSEDENDIDKKYTLKDKRLTVLQLRQFRNRCIDLFDIIILYSPNLAIRMNGFFAFLNLLKKSDTEVEIHLMKSISSFRTKFVTKETFSSQEITEFIRNLIQVVEKCHQTKNIVKIFSDVMVTLLRINKNDVVNIVSEFKIIIDNCIIDKKNHPMKAVFLTMFDTFPEIGWAFHSQLLNYVDEKQTLLVQYRAFEILRRIFQNQSMKVKLFQKDDEMEADLIFSKSDIRTFVSNFSTMLVSIIINLDIEKNSKHSSIVLGSFIDCVKLCPDMEVSVDVMNKVKKVNSNGLPKDLKKTINKFISAVNLSKCSRKL